MHTNVTNRKKTPSFKQEEPTALAYQAEGELS